MNKKIVTQMSNIVSDIMTSFQSDFEKYDKPYIESAAACNFPMIWIVGKSHTYLLKLGDYKKSFFGNESVRLAYVQGDDTFSCFLNMCGGDHLFLIEKEKVSRITVDQARAAILDYVNPAVGEWESRNGKLPRKCKVKVRLGNITIEKLKQLVRDCEAHGNTSLMNILKRFHSYHQTAEDQFIQIHYNQRYNEFGFCEYVNGKPRLNGGIIFHGWPETGYKTNNSFQLIPKYGWALHT